MSINNLVNYLVAYSLQSCQIYCLKHMNARHHLNSFVLCRHQLMPQRKLWQYSVPFVGFFSYQKGNPLEKKYYTPNSTPKTCLAWYSQHVASTEEGCLINYCTKMKSSVTLVNVKNPPFVRNLKIQVSSQITQEVAGQRYIPCQTISLDSLVQFKVGLLTMETNSP